MNEILIINKNDISKLLCNAEDTILELVKEVYIQHIAGQSVLPYSVFLRFPNNSKNRIIALPAYINNTSEMAGLKWISSFPENINNGIERASAILILNNINNGRVEAILESSIISAKRTAASAALAAKYIHSNSTENTLGIVGCGTINKEIFCFLQTIFPQLKDIYIYDIVPKRSLDFCCTLSTLDPNLRIHNTNNIDYVLQNCSLISFATTANVPYLDDLSKYPNIQTILNISLRDLSPNVILSCENVVDDIDHVCRENTSIHLTEQFCGNRNFITCQIADIFRGTISNLHSKNRPIIYSPFGLGVLDVALGKYVKDQALNCGLGTKIYDFFT